MLDLKTTKQFDKDLKRNLKRGKSREKIFRIMQMILNQISLPPQNRDHKLQGEWQDCRECHIEPDWLLIYRLEEDAVSFERNGSHSDLFS